MIRIFIFIIFAASALSASYFLIKSDDKKKRTFLIGGGALAAAFALLLQSAFSLYLSLAAIVGISLIGALGYAKYIEKEQEKNQQLLQERRSRKSRTLSQPVESAKKPVHEPIAEKPFGMQTIAVIREEREVE